ncbi:ABC transporter substrate-binding protein [Paraburkholderia susongensis]|uniref:Carbohydrate ABC transporter substrate-binding protein, CUT1 family n=1 Tax=Paraburkholderia susongensis TaxID=1515439 RepID=A0A1X7LK51_9BURK|nr:extracellular solute-binding protein [Paraburkholderia susongensis]SMG53723.1 carbohydrate ABC transporter substrate-binding protein, CUT1 family [Paraburkholderia susongensis]
MKIVQYARQGAVSLLLTAALSCAQAGTLVINSNAADTAVKNAFDAAVAGFKAENPDVDVKVNTFDTEGYKTSIRNFLSAEPPDVVTWYAGHRMAPFVDAGLFEDVTDLWTKNGLDQSLKSAASAMTLNGKKWGIPYSYYAWGIYYRKDLFAKLGIQPPTTWKELLDASAKLKANGITPFAIGTKQPWTTASWFDYLDMRMNGYAFHMDLTSGKVPYTDKRVEAVFDRWDELTRPGYFLANHASYTWEEAVPALVKGEAAMYLMGNFAVAPMKQAGLGESQLGFMPFPQIAPNVPRAEEAPIETLHIPSKARNKADARRFLTYMSRPDVQARFGAMTEELPVNRNAPPPTDPYLRAGAAMLADAAGLSQFYDRDAPAEMAKAGMDGFQHYMLQPDSREEVLKHLEQVRQRVYKQ